MGSSRSGTRSVRLYHCMNGAGTRRFSDDDNVVFARQNPNFSFGGNVVELNVELPVDQQGDYHFEAQSAPAEHSWGTRENGDIWLRVKNITSRRILDQNETNLLRLANDHGLLLPSQPTKKEIKAVTSRRIAYEQKTGKMSSNFRSFIASLDRAVVNNDRLPEPTPSVRMYAFLDQSSEASTWGGYRLSRNPGASFGSDQLMAVDVPQSMLEQKGVEVGDNFTVNLTDAEYRALPKASVDRKQIVKFESTGMNPRALNFLDATKTEAPSAE